MPKAYCGVGKMPKGSRRGTMKECAEQGQVRYYGLKKIDARTLEGVTTGKKKRVTREQALHKKIVLEARVKNWIKKIKNEEDKGKKKKMLEEAKKAVAQLNEAKKVLKKVRKASRVRRARRQSRARRHRHRLVL